MKRILQAFKQKIFNKRKAYICDPYRARKCTKEACWAINHGPCKCTIKKAYAKRDINGKPVIASDEDLCNEDYYDYCIMMEMSKEGYAIPEDK